MHGVLLYPVPGMYEADEGGASCYNTYRSCRVLCFFLRRERAVGSPLISKHSDEVCMLSLIHI